jgi:hypothetical protein
MAVDATSIVDLPTKARGMSAEKLIFNKDVGLYKNWGCQTLEFYIIRAPGDTPKMPRFGTRWGGATSTSCLLPRLGVLTPDPKRHLHHGWLPLVGRCKCCQMVHGRGVAGVGWGAFIPGQEHGVGFSRSQEHIILNSLRSYDTYDTVVPLNCVHPAGWGSQFCVHGNCWNHSVRAGATNRKADSGEKGRDKLLETTNHSG